MADFDPAKLDVAITYMDRIADGKNPVTNKPAPEQDVLNNPNVIRCMFFIRDVLRSVRDNGGTIGNRKSSAKSEFPLKNLEQFQYRGDTTISRIVQQMNQGIDKQLYKTFTVQMVIKWLESQGLVDTHPNGSERQHTLPTDQGRIIGIQTEQREYNGKTYEAVVYNEEAQKLIVSHAEEILTGNVKISPKGYNEALTEANIPD